MSRDRAYDPRRLNLPVFAAEAGVCQGELPRSALPRLAASVLALPGDAVAPPIAWSAAGEQRSQPGGTRSTWLHLSASTAVTLQCQRCLQAMSEPLRIDRWFHFVGSEEEAARLDEECEEDVLVSSARFDLLDLIEDELILALPIVPRHAECAQPLPTGSADEGAEQALPNPFAALAALRRPPPGN